MFKLREGKRRNVISRIAIGAAVLSLSHSYSQASPHEYRRDTVVSQQYVENGRVHRSDDLVLSVVITLTSGTSWVVPSDFNTADNTIECYGGGAGGGGGAPGDGFTNGGGGGGGGSGSYAKNTNVALTPGASVPYAIGPAGSGGGALAIGTAGGDTNFNSGLIIGKGGSPGSPGVGTPSPSGGVGGAGGVLGTGTTRIAGQAGTSGAGNGFRGDGGIGTGGFGNGGIGGDGGPNVGNPAANGVAGRIVITYTPAKSLIYKPNPMRFMILR